MVEFQIFIRQCHHEAVALAPCGLYINETLTAFVRGLVPLTGLVNYIGNWHQRKREAKRLPSEIDKNKNAYPLKLGMPRFLHILSHISRSR